MPIVSPRCLKEGADHFGPGGSKVSIDVSLIWTSEYLPGPPAVSIRGPIDYGFMQWTPY